MSTSANRTQGGIDDDVDDDDANMLSNASVFAISIGLSPTPN